jgi:hypothetical protein
LLNAVSPTVLGVIKDRTGSLASRLFLALFVVPKGALRVGPGK